EDESALRLCDDGGDSFKHFQLVLCVGQHLLAPHDRLKILPSHKHNRRPIVLSAGQSLDRAHELLKWNVLKIELVLQGHAELAHCSTGDLIFTPLRVGQPHPDKGDVELGDHAVAQCPVVPHLEDYSAEIRIED